MILLPELQRDPKGSVFFRKEMPRRWIVDSLAFARLLACDLVKQTGLVIPNELAE